MFHQKTLIVLTLPFLLLSSACTKKAGKTIWIYTSMYKDVVSQTELILKKKFPGVDFKIYQSGSENVAARLNAELSTGKPQADLVLTSDPFWYLELKKAGHLMAYPSPATAKVAPEFKDADGFFSVVRFCIGVIAYEKNAVPPAEAPKSWSDLTNPKWKGKISVGSPLESGTAVSLISQLVRKKGWDYMNGLKANDLLSAGGNSAVAQRMETKERPIGMILLENALEAQQKGSPIEIVYPTDGVILVPSPIAILAKTKEPGLAKQVYDAFFSDEVQKSILSGRMHSPVLTDLGPSGSKPFKEIQVGAFEWNGKLLEELQATKEETKKKFSDMILR